MAPSSSPSLLTATQEPPPLLSPSSPLSSQPLSSGLYNCNKCSRTCEDTDIQPLGCDIEELYGDLVMHPALIRVCCSECWNFLWNEHMGTTTQGGE